MNPFWTTGTSVPTTPVTYINKAEQNALSNAQNAPTQSNCTAVCKTPAAKTEPAIKTTMERRRRFDGIFFSENKFVKRTNPYKLKQENNGK